MTELLVAKEPFLKVGHHVHFSEKWDASAFANKVFEVKVTQQIPRILSYILAPTTWLDVDLLAVGFYPDSVQTLYETLFMIKGTNILLYVRFPNTDYFNRLEFPGFETVTLTDPNLRYIGQYTEEDTPEPLIREYMIKQDYMQRVIYRLYNDGAVDEKAVLKGIVNRCRLREVTDLKRVNAILDSGKYREVLHVSTFQW